MSDETKDEKSGSQMPLEPWTPEQYAKAHEDYFDAGKALMAHDEAHKEVLRKAGDKRKKLVGNLDDLRKAIDEQRPNFTS